MQVSLPDGPAQPQGHPTSQVPCTAVIVTYQSAAHIGTLLKALQAERQNCPDLHVLVVDNASTDRTSEIVAGFGWVRLVPSGGNVGYAAAVNIGDSLAPPDHALLVLNADVVPASGALARLLSGVDLPGVGVTVPRIEDADGSLYPSLRNEPSIGRALVDAIAGKRAGRLSRRWSGIVWDPQAYEHEQAPDWATGAALLVSSACRKEVGRWDEQYFLYSEETDFLRRVRAAGLQVRFDPTVIVRHIGGGSGTSDGLYALCVANSIRYYRRYHARPASLAFATMVALHQFLRVGRPEARLALRALVSPAARAGLPRPSPPRPAPQQAP